MVRILGTNLNSKKKLFLALRAIYGIGLSQALKILSFLKIDPLKKVEKLNDFEAIALRNFLEGNNLLLEGSLKRYIQQNIKHLVETNSYRGKRHLKGLPTRGQRTRTNSRTVRKFRKLIQNKN